MVSRDNGYIDIGGSNKREAELRILMVTPYVSMNFICMKKISVGKIALEFGVAHCFSLPTYVRKIITVSKYPNPVFDITRNHCVRPCVQNITIVSRVSVVRNTCAN